MSDTVTQDIIQFKALKDDDDARFCDLVHLVKRCYNTLKEVGLPSDVNNSHMHSIIEQKMCADDRKVWARDLEKEKKPATLEALMNWMNVEMKSRMRATAPIRVGSSAKRPVYHFKSDSDKPVSHKCGKSPGHVRQNCPAKAAICHKCSKKGQWASVCKSSQTVGEIEEDYAFLGAIGTERNEDIWSVDLTLNNSLVFFKIDTGADVTVIPESVYKKLKPTPTLIRSSKTLFGPAHTTLPVLGCFMGVIKRGEESSSQKIFVVNGPLLTLLGRPAIETLKIVQTVNAVEAEEVKEKFPNLFKGLGKLDGPDYVIKLKPDAKPHAISTPRRVPVPLLSKVKEELSRMEQMEIISKVDEPTEWCAGMVVVPKANGKVRICVDLAKLNESILREYHPLPTHTLAQLAGATIFSKLDANSGFWQIGLSPESA